jgi:hypothetical protein
VAAIFSPNSENQFGDDLALRDVNYYFAWVSFTNPLAPLVPSLNGDYNNNGIVDASDYVVWRKAGPTATLPNDPTPGTVDLSDYTTWRANFGSSASLAAEAGAGLGAQGVPEPTAIVLCAVLVASIATVRGRTRIPSRVGVFVRG